MNFKRILLGIVAVSALTLTACDKPGDTNNATDSNGQAVSDQVADVKTMDGKELDALQADNKKKDKVLVVDVRSKEEYDEGHLKHAINVPIDDVEADPEVLADYKDFPIILYCNTGNKSGKVADILVENGYKDVTNADGVKSYEYENIVTYSNLTAKDFLAMKDDATVVDARPEEDYKEGHIEGAVSVPFDAVDDNMDKVPEGKPVIAYCFTGNKSSEVAKALEEKGYEVFNVIEGTKEYEYDLVK
ncbi:MAG: rhodanese-like domain-containing protein [Lagierella massiliensis]|nr:rhodanese-like domain-containing protein [Lagierella massiliensis]